MFVCSWWLVVKNEFATPPPYSRFLQAGSPNAKDALLFLKTPVFFIYFFIQLLTSDICTLMSGR
jgi:hypothetical protein